jgi:serine/threonine protein kinase
MVNWNIQAANLFVFLFLTMPGFTELFRLPVLSSLHSVTLRTFMFIGYYSSSVWSTWRCIANHFPRPFRGLKSNIPTDNTISPTGQQPDYMTYTMRLQPQRDLEMIGVGSSGQVYKIDDCIVLKACRVFERPASDASPRDKWFYASDTVFHYSLINNERTVFRLLEQRPHANIIESLDTDHAEGIYLRRYLSLSEIEVPNQIGRILWYQDIVRALLHIHRLGIAHSDLRLDNVLFDQRGRALLSDFSAASPFGKPNPALPRAGLPVPLNGLSEVVSAATDRFAMGSLIFQMEHGMKPTLSVDANGALILPKIHSGHDGIDAAIERAWLEKYTSTAQMLDHLDSLHPGGSRYVYFKASHNVSRDLLRDRIRQWRERRNHQFGKHYTRLFSSLC